MKEYSFHYYMTICHSSDNDYEHRHYHTLEVLTEITDKDESFPHFERFDQMEKYAGNYIKKYENIYLNDLPEFLGDARIEKIGDVFFDGLEMVLKEKGLYLNRLEIGDSPIHTYVLTRKI